jgi:diguanylate cyclase (GGDEF)-like protein
MGDTLWVLHLVPVAVATWYASWRWGTAVAVLGLVLAGSLPAAGADGTTSGIGGVEFIVRFGLLGVLVLVVAEARMAVGEERQWIRSDPSTGLANTRALFDQVAAEVERAQRYERPFSLAYVGIENLPALRQRHGDAAAEEVLRRVAHQIQASLRSVDLVARLRDREFALLFPETGPAAAKIVLGRIERLLDLALSQEVHQLSFILGAVTWVHSDLTVPAIHQRTYQLMYAARREDVRVRHEILDEETIGEAANRHQAVRG